MCILLLYLMVGIVQDFELYMERSYLTWTIFNMYQSFLIYPMKTFSLLFGGASSVINLSFFFLFSSMSLIFSDAKVLSFISYSSVRARLATILEIPAVVSLFFFCIILTWSNNLLFSPWIVSASYHTSDAHFSCSFDEQAITCFWLRTVFPKITHFNLTCITLFGYINQFH